MYRADGWPVPAGGSVRRQIQSGSQWVSVYRSGIASLEQGRKADGGRQRTRLVVSSSLSWRLVRCTTIGRIVSRQLAYGKQCAMNSGGSRPPSAPSSIYHQ